MSFATFLNQDQLQDRYDKVRNYFALRESAYDVSNACQLRCEGCYFFEGKKYLKPVIRDTTAWRTFFRSERDRGINYVNLAGAEPALVPDVLRACSESIPLGTVFTNGLKPLSLDLPYRIHISIWGNADGDPLFRRAYGGSPSRYALPIQLKNYEKDKRAIFVYTFNEMNIEQIDDVAEAVCGEGHQITFNVFSSPDLNSRLRLTKMLGQVQKKMLQIMEKYGPQVVYSFYNVFSHTQDQSLFAQFGCPYPRAAGSNPGLGGISASFRSYRTDLSHEIENDCCVPDTQCTDCRHYAAGSAIVTSRLRAHGRSEELFRGWLDYVDTYLAIWLVNYDRGENLFSKEMLNGLVSRTDKREDSLLDLPKGGL